jgi:hypothetical protein
MRVMHGEEIEQRRVRAWRRAQLAGAGFSPALADRLAGDERYDLHALIELTERGCAPELAARILAPLDVVGEAA